METDIKPIRSEADHGAALAEISRLWGALSGTPDGDRLDVLATLVEAWEAEHVPICPPDPISAIEFRIDAMGLTHRDIEHLFGGEPQMSEVFAGQRRLSLEMIRRLNAELGIPAEILIRPMADERVA